MFSRRSFLGALPALYSFIRMPRLSAAAMAKSGREYHVSTAGNDKHDGSSSRPLRTQLRQPSKLAAIFSRARGMVTPTSSARFPIGHPYVQPVSTKACR